MRTSSLWMIATGELFIHKGRIYKVLGLEPQGDIRVENEYGSIERWAPTVPVEVD